MSGLRDLARRFRKRLPASARHLEGIGNELGALASSQAGVHARIDAVERRLSQVQGLTARVYEAQRDWAGRLEAIRGRSDYEKPFSGTPLVSVRVGTYNRAQILCERSLASVRRQTYEHWEALVVGDQCDDDTAERVEAFGDPRIRFWNLPLKGPYPEDPQSRWQVAGTMPFNAATDAASGAWIAPIDDDDEWEDDHIEVLLRVAQERRAELSYGRMRVKIEATGQETEFGSWPPRPADFGFQSALYHAHLKEFRYDVNAWLADEVGDWNLARRMWEAGARFSFVDRIVGTYFVPPDHPNQEGWQGRAVIRPLRS
jgi:hypothetical protein